MPETSHHREKKGGQGSAGWHQPETSNCQVAVGHTASEKNEMGVRQQGTDCRCQQKG